METSGICAPRAWSSSRWWRPTARRGAAAPPNPISWGMLDLVALATVADVAPLVGVNRAFVRQGLKVMARRRRQGLRALADAARLDSPPTSYHLGFVLGPRVNAGGRIGQADLGARLLSTADSAEAEALAARLETLNTERRGVEGRQCARPPRRRQKRGARTARSSWAAGDGWHPGWSFGIRGGAAFNEWAGRPGGRHQSFRARELRAKGSGRFRITGFDLSARRSSASPVRQGFSPAAGAHNDGTPDLSFSDSLRQLEVGPMLGGLGAASPWQATPPQPVPPPTLRLVWPAHCPARATPSMLIRTVLVAQGGPVRGACGPARPLFWRSPRCGSPTVAGWATAT